MAPGTSHATELYQRVDEVLHYVWDPIGVSGTPQARDEYASYVSGVVSLLKSGRSERAIAEHLLELSSKSMGLARDEARARNTASVLVDWYESLRERGL